jgi:hypothetical protein
VELDRHCPGVAGSFLRSSDERRQVVASLLAAERLGPSSSPVRLMTDLERARLIATADHQTLLAAGFGSPRGMRGALRRAGHKPHAARFYSYVYHLLSAPTCDALASTIEQMPRLDMVTLKIIRRLPRDLRSPSLIATIERVETAKDIASLTALMADSGIERSSLVASLRQVRTRRELARLWTRWSLKAVFPTQPLEESPLVKPVLSAAELRRLGLKYHNCAERYVSEALEGRTAFCEFLGQRRGLVVHLRRLEERWVISDIYAARNGQVSRQARDDAIRHFAELGFHERTRRRPEVGGWSALRRLTGYHHFYEDDDEE